MKNFISFESGICVGSESSSANFVLLCCFCLFAIFPRKLFLFLLLAHAFLSSTFDSVGVSHRTVVFVVVAP